MRSLVKKIVATLSLALTATALATTVAWAATFPDVPEGEWYTESAYRAADLGLITGYGDSELFGPGNPLTRAQAASILWRYYTGGGGEPQANSTGLRDVKDYRWYTAAANWAVASGVIHGKGGTAFDPNGPLTREELCVIVAKASESFAGSKTSGADRSALRSMPDASSVSSWATNAVAWCLNEGVISGKASHGRRLVDPQGTVTRAEMAKILINCIDNNILSNRCATEGHDCQVTAVAADGTCTYSVCSRCGSAGTDSDTLTYAQIVAILWRYYEPDEAAAYDASTAQNTTGMTDVEDAQWYTGAANWAVRNGIYTGQTQADGSKLFTPSGSLTREQACLIFANAAQVFAGTTIEGTDATKLNALPDADSVSSGMTDACAWSLNNGIVTSKALSRLEDAPQVFAPQDPVTRYEMNLSMRTAINYDLLVPTTGLNALSWAELKGISEKIGAASSQEEAIQIAIAEGIIPADGKLTGNETKKIVLPKYYKFDTSKIKFTDEGYEGEYVPSWSNEELAVEVQIVGIWQDTLVDGTKAGITWAFKDIPGSYRMNATDITTGGWAGSMMRAWVNSEFFDTLPADLQAVIEPTAKSTNNVGLVTENTAPTAVTTTSDKLWLLSATEIYGDSWISWTTKYEGWPWQADVYAAEGAQYKLFADNNVKVPMAGETQDNPILLKTAHGTASGWFLRSTYTNKPLDYDQTTFADGLFFRVTSDANWFRSLASTPCGAAPGFCL